MVADSSRNPSGHAQQFDALSPALWNPIGNAVVAAARLEEGHRVLNAYCRTGASAIPAAQIVGRQGCVDAVDPAPDMLELTQHKAQALGLDNLNLHLGDSGKWSSQIRYNAVVSSYELFTLPDPAEAARHLIAQLVPAGRFAVTTWASGAQADFAEALFDLCRRFRPESRVRAESVTANTLQVDTPSKLDTWLGGLGLTEVQIAPTEASVPLNADRAWSLVEGCWYADLLPDNTDDRASLRAELIRELGDDFVLNTGTLIAVATAPH